MIKNAVNPAPSLSSKIEKMALNKFQNPLSYNNHHRKYILSNRNITYSYNQINFQKCLIKCLPPF